MSVTPTPQQCIEYVIAAQGNTKLAAARLDRDVKQQNAKDAPSTPDDTITEARLLTIITQDPNSINTLTTQIRLLTVMQATDAFRLTHAAFLASLPELSPPAISRAYLALLNVMSTLSNITTSPVDPYDAVMRSLPSEVTSALQNILASSENKASAAPQQNNIALPTIISQPAPPQGPVTAQNVSGSDPADTDGS